MSCGRWVDWLPLYSQEATGVLDGNIRGEHADIHRRRLTDSERTPYTQAAGDWSLADAVHIYPRQQVDRGEWVTEFRVETSVDGTTFTSVGSFAANRDRETAVRSPFPDVTFPQDWNEIVDGTTPKPKKIHRIVPSSLDRRPADIVARYVRIIPTTWHGYVSLRADVEAYSAPASMRVASTGTAGDAALGAAQAWIPAVAQQGEWVQVDLGTEKRVAAVITQGRGDADEWVTLYRVEHSLNGVHYFTLGEYIANWTLYANGTTATNVPTVNATNADASPLSRTFAANSDRNTMVRNPWHTNTVARYVRVFPLAWHTAPALRFDVEAIPPPGTLSFSFGAAVVTATGGQYRLCWCALAPCVVASDYIENWTLYDIVTT
jgi:hypothetical protein